MMDSDCMMLKSDVWICQVFTAERLCIPTTKGRSTVISAVNKRKDEVYRKLVDEYTTVENAPFGFCRV
jgi:hypothetical protein